jgi:hypothetical protein
MLGRGQHDRAERVKQTQKQFAISPDFLLEDENISAHCATQQTFSKFTSNRPELGKMKSDMPTIEAEEVLMDYRKERSQSPHYRSKHCDSDAVSQTQISQLTQITSAVQATKNLNLKPKQLRPKIESCLDGKLDIEETVMKEVVSPKIVNLYNQTATTNKFSNFGFFAGSPRQTAMAGVSGNIN